MPFMLVANFNGLINNETTHGDDDDDDDDNSGGGGVKEAKWRFEKYSKNW